MSYHEFREEMSEEEVPSNHIKIFNVGWIDQKHFFMVGASPIKFVDKLKKLIIHSETCPFKPIVWRCRGQDKCSLCEEKDLVLEEGDNREVLGSSEFFIPRMSGEDMYFISPTLIYHSIVAHDYLPPPEFIDSVLAIDENFEYDGDTIYMNALGLEELYLEYK